MPPIKSRKISSRKLPYTTSKPKKPTGKKQKGKPNTASLPASQQIIREMFQSEFVAPEAALPLTALGDLSNEILPIFRAANFPGVKDYKVIAPSARLASHLLKHPSLRRMLRTILKHGDLQPLNESDSDGKPMFRYPNNTHRITDKDIALINSSLDDLAAFVTFRPDAKLTRANARTDPSKRKRKQDCRTKTLLGIRSTIRYSPELLKTLTDATKNLTKTQDVPLLLTWRFAFAVHLAHETCHALTLAKDGHLPELDTEPFFPKAITAEVGFTMEETLFGGLPTLLWDNEQPGTEDAHQGYLTSSKQVSDFVGLSAFWSWPCTSVIRGYQHENLALWIRKSDEANLKPKDVAWRVPLQDLARFFDSKFWEHENPATRLDRETGFAFSCDAEGARVPADFSPRELRSHALRGFKISEHRALVSGRK